jgi:hypothetical protein
MALAASLALPPSLFAGQHVVSESDVRARLVASASERAAQRASLERLLDSPAAAEAAAASGLDLQELRARVGLLSDGELRELAARADALQTDPVAGGLSTFWIVTIVVVALLVLAALIVEDCKEQGAECVN